MELNPKIDLYLAQGCMRCAYGGTDKCKVHSWTDELQYLRNIALESGLKEELKWGVPCYTYNDSNVLNVSALKESAVLSFFKGVLLKDQAKLLEAPGENSQSVRLAKFTNLDQIKDHEQVLRSYIVEAIEIEKQGKKVHFKKNPEPIPEELEHVFEQKPEVEKAFYALTPGRQRGYILHFSQPKQSKTRVSRIEKYIPRIMEGLGFHDR